MLMIIRYAHRSLMNSTHHISHTVQGSQRSSRIERERKNTYRAESSQCT